MNKSFQQCVSEICGLEIASLMADGKYTVYGNNVAVVEGHKGIVEYSEETVSFVFGDSVLDIRGDKLKIKCLQRNCSVVAGKIYSVAVRDV